MTAPALPRIALEDEFVDILGKAQRGHGLGNRGLSEKTGIGEEVLDALKNGRIDEAALDKVAKALGLSATALGESARGEWYPDFPERIDGIAMVNTPFSDMTTNAYVLWSPENREAFVIDTGTDASPLLEICRENELKVQAILLTHTHGDHVAELSRLAKETGAPVFVSEHENIAEAEPFSEGKVFEARGLRVETFLTWGHSRGGITYRVSGLATPVAFTGDSIFAGSMGGGMDSYMDQLNNIREKILTLPGDTVLFPGHGPPTTVDQEKRHNPFFAH